MKPSEYNKEAREAFGKTLVDIGMAVFKGIILLFTIIPITAILKSIFDGPESTDTMVQAFFTMDNGTYLLLVGFIGLSFLIGHIFRKEGLKHIHAANQENA
ncbi:hypothetical protein [Microbulbifer celer]|uniref:Uncharacterized protein n=1 Tax=Microbulbifer celer TaxID=435905 RepID=A0ABW3UD69_9GAMM|nr:hypothetical protein [Microbulbifer celer]UFN58117.1 hypothetical protein LPW13_03445 [Microbulbifer celer]